MNLNDVMPERSLFSSLKQSRRPSHLQSLVKLGMVYTICAQCDPRFIVTRVFFGVHSQPQAMRYTNSSVGFAVKKSDHILPYVWNTHPGPQK